MLVVGLFAVNLIAVRAWITKGPFSILVSGRLNLSFLDLVLALLGRILVVLIHLFVLFVRARWQLHLVTQLLLRTLINILLVTS